MPRLGNLVCVVQWPGVNVNAHGVDGTMIPPGTGTLHGQQVPSCIYIWWVLTCQCLVHRAHSIPPCVQQIKVIKQSQWDLSHNLHGIDTGNNIMTVELNRHLGNLHLYLLCNQHWHPLLTYIRRWLNTRR